MINFQTYETLVNKRNGIKATISNASGGVNVPRSQRQHFESAHVTVVTYVVCNQHSNCGVILTDILPIKQHITNTFQTLKLPYHKQPLNTCYPSMTSSDHDVIHSKENHLVKRQQSVRMY